MINYQNIIDFLTTFFYVLAPIAIIFSVIEIITNFFISLIRGDRRVKL